ncbi:calcium homeostasis modulator protein 1 [Ictalurus punctatus]|uniref:Calcium homeostasis modulator protein 1 n=1 Tax=Ictalurus punctatus TaxID=7998 RepID=A0A2D0Q6C0_ICTPU|nr:calcium homeostasis modulator protein 1 [Ictalurus punctatus]
MDKFRMMFQFLQSNQESFMHGVCGLMALASAQLYSAFEFNCPCMPEYNYSYGIGVLVIPAVWFFLLGFVLNNNVSILSEEWKRPAGHRAKDPAILRYMFVSVSQRSLIAPAVWITVTLMDGKSFLCAFSVDLDVSEFVIGNFTGHNLSSEEMLMLLAKIPCKHIFDGQHIFSREAATRYIRCVSQAFGWLFLLILTLIAFTVRAMRPCFSQAVFLKTKYWSHYADLERKIFDEICAEHAKSFAKVCIHQYFESESGDMRSLHGQNGDDSKEDDDEQPKEEDKLLGIHAQEDMNKVLWNWHISKPPLSLRKPGAGDDANKKVNGSQNGVKTGYDNVTFTTDQKDYEDGHITSRNGNSYMNGNAPMNRHAWNDSPSSVKKKEWAVYYSKV